MAVGSAAARGLEEVLKDLQKLLMKYKNAGNKAKAAEVQKKITQTRAAISKKNQKAKEDAGKAVPRMSQKEQKTVKKNIKKDLGGATEKVKRKEAAAYAKAATSPEAKKTSGSVSTARGRRNKTNQYEAGRYKGRKSKKAGEMYKASPNTPEKAEKNTLRPYFKDKDAPRGRRTRSARAKADAFAGQAEIYEEGMRDIATKAPAKKTVAKKAVAKKAAAKKAATKPRLRKTADAKPSSTQGVTVGKPKLTRTARKKKSAQSMTPAGKPRVRGPKANAKESVRGMTPIGGKSSSSKGSLTVPKSNAPTVSRRTASQSKAGNISTRVEKDMGRAQRVDNKTTKSMEGGKKSSTPSSSRRNAAARKTSPAKKRGSTLKKAAGAAAVAGGIAYMMGKEDKKKESKASPTKPKKVTTGTGGNANRTNRTSVTSGATKPRNVTSNKKSKERKKKRESRYEKKWGELKWGDEGSLPQVQYRKRKRK